MRRFRAPLVAWNVCRTPSFTRPVRIERFGRPRQRVSASARRSSSSFSLIRSSTLMTALSASRTAPPMPQFVR